MERLRLYARVSTDDQQTSVSAQVLRLKEFAAAEGKEVAGLYVDEDVSGAKPLKLRPQGKLLWDATEPGDVVVFTKVDRAFRSLTDAVTTLEVWQHLGVSVRILDTGMDLATPAGQLFFSQLVGFAQFERALLGQRLKEAVAQCRREERPFANFRPFGWKVAGSGKQKRFEPLPEERALAERIVQMRKEGESWCEIATVFYRERITKPGKSLRQRKWRGVFYLETEVRRLHKAALAGFPITPRDSVTLPGGGEADTVTESEDGNCPSG